VELDFSRVSVALISTTPPRGPAVFHRHPSWGGARQCVACAGDRPLEIVQGHSERHTAPSGFWRWELRTSLCSIRGGPAASDRGAHNRLTVGRHLIQSPSRGRISCGCRVRAGWHWGRRRAGRGSFACASAGVRGEDRAKPRPGPSVRSTLRAAAEAWTGFARCYV